MGMAEGALASNPNFQEDLSHQKWAPGWLGYIGHYTTQVYREYNKPL